MKTKLSINKAVFLPLLTAVLALVFLITTPLKAQSQYFELNVLTINLLFSEIEDRDARLETIAQFVADYDEPIDLILLQEVVGGRLAKTGNSAVDLKNKLAAKGVNYELSYRLANGIPGILSVGNAILSRHKILFTVAATLPFVSEEIIEGVEIPLKRKIMMSRIELPDFGKINVYNTHLCAYCDQEERMGQVEHMLAFIKTVESFFQSRHQVILGGDFNAEYDSAEYNRIIKDGFFDTYAQVNCPDCCSELDPSGCTFAVPCEVTPCNPYAVNPFTGLPEEPARIDYIFARTALEVISSSVVFNQAPWVSDHSGVLTKLRLK